MEEFQLNIRGTREFQRALLGFNERLAQRVTKSVLRQGANYMTKAIKAAAPKKTGRLRRAIKVKNSKINTLRSNGKVGLFISISPGKSRTDPKGAWYGPFQEDGYHAMGTRPAREITRSATTRAQRADHQQRTGKRLRVYDHHGARKIEGKHFIRNTFGSTKHATVQVIVSAYEVAARKLAQQIGFRITG
jgi:HK97 gp10 family phage protein